MMYWVAFAFLLVSFMLMLRGIVALCIDYNIPKEDCGIVYYTAVIIWSSIGLVIVHNL